MPNSLEAFLRYHLKKKWTDNLKTWCRWLSPSPAWLHQKLVRRTNTKWPLPFITDISPISVTLPDVIKLGSSFVTLLIESSTSSLMWSIPITFPLGPTCGAQREEQCSVHTRTSPKHQTCFICLYVISIGWQANQSIRICRQGEIVCVYPSCVAHHSCEASGQDSTARADVQSFCSLVQLVV